MPSPARLSKRFCAAGTNGRLDLSLPWQASEDLLKRPSSYDQGSEIHSEPRRVSLPFGEAQLARCLKVWVGGCWSGTQASSDYVQGVVQDTVYEHCLSVNAATPDWCALLSC